MKKIVTFIYLLMLLSLSGLTFAAVLIDLDASGLPEGDLTSWTNAGTAGGTFYTADVDGDEVVDPNALVVTIDGKKGVYFADGAWMQSDITAPAALTAANAPFTVMVWADPNGASQTGEDTLFAWADRGQSSTASFNAGTNYAFTSFTNDCYWTSADPPTNQWVHLAMTYNGSTATLYINGLPTDVFEREYDIADGFYMRIARQLPDNYGMHPYTGAIASIQVHDAALSRAEIQNAMGMFVEAGQLSPTGLSLMEGNGTGNITLQLQANNTTGQGPTEDLQITLSLVGTYTDAALGTSEVGQPYVITVPAATYSNPIIIPITAQDDNILENAHNVYVQAVVTAGDPAYQAATIFPAAGLAVKIVDNDYLPCPDPIFSNGAYTDEFSCLWDFTQGTTGMWDGLMNAENLYSANTVQTAGKLHIESTGNWGGADAGGPFLYTEVTGDFVAEIHMDPPVESGPNGGGLMVRLGGDTALGGAGEDNMLLYWMPGWSVGSIFWPTDNNNRPENDITWDGLNAPSYLRVERRGANFFWSRSYDGATWQMLPSANPMVRSDMNVATLQVGVVQAFGSEGASVQYDYFKLTPTRGSISGTPYLTESIGETGTVQIQMDTEGFPAPLADLEVTLSAAAASGADPNSDPNDIKIGTAAQGEPYTFTIPAASYDQPQSINVTAVIDAINEADQLLTLSADVVSTDPNWNGLFLALEAQITVMETPGLLVQTADGVEVSEGGAGDSFTVRLKTSPAATPVTVSVADNADPDQVAFNSASLSFGATDWMTPQTVTVNAVDDAVLENDPHGTTITLTPSNGGDYDVAASTVDISILENECGAWGYVWGDFNTDCTVDISDLLALAGDWLTCTNPYDPGCIDLRP